jgi:FAD/FMN-containing dehydrogenase
MGSTLPGSTCVGVGISGLTLGGGIGHATRALGVLADVVLEATVVLANGTVVEADSKNNPDLFWVSL